MTNPEETQVLDEDEVPPQNIMTDEEIREKVLASGAEGQTAGEVNRDPVDWSQYPERSFEEARRKPPASQPQGEGGQ